MGKPVGEQVGWKKVGGLVKHCDQSAQHAPSVGRRDSAAAGFPRGRRPEFPWRKSQWDNTVVKIKSV